jgi:glycosyltransferase involved in cell wall biosynthesis
VAASVLREAARPTIRRLTTVLTRRWAPYSRLFLVGEGIDWVIDHELRAVGRLAESLGVRVADRRLLMLTERQSAFYGSHFTLLGRPWEVPTHRLGTAYFHGRPGTPGMPEFDAAYEALTRRHSQLERVQVSHSELEDVVLSTGIDPAKVFRIPIGVEPGLFPVHGEAAQRAARSELGLPEDAFVVGSFHKDGVGFGDGTEPKPIKGPDVLLAALALVREQEPRLHVLLSGPARGFVRAGLGRLGIPYAHRQLDRYAEIGRLYAALDAYVVPSRQEGGPKGVLEAMASGVPLVTTRVGQAMDLVRHAENGWMVEVEDADGLARWLLHVARRPPELERIVAAGLATAAANTYEAQRPLWQAFFAGFVADS